MKIIPATLVQRAAYSGMYPLFGFVEVAAEGRDDKLLCSVEDLRGHWSRENPQWEVLAPKGWVFSGDCTHSLLGFTQRDMLDRIYTLELDTGETA